MTTKTPIGPDWIPTVADWKEDSGKRYPVLNGRISSDASQVTVWCAFCEDWHYHGRPRNYPGGGSGHRVAHCHDWGRYGRRHENSPYAKTGYVVRELNRTQWLEIAAGLQGPLSVDCPQCKTPIGIACVVKRKTNREFHAKREEMFTKNGSGWMYRS